MRWLSLFLLFLLFSSSAIASEAPFVSFGNDYIDRCGLVERDPKTFDATEKAQYFYCLGYTAGLFETIAASEARQMCLPDESITTLQTARIIMKWIREHPERGHELTAALGLAALKQAFPCKNLRPQK